MKTQEAEQVVDEMANGKMHSIKWEKTTWSNGRKTTECRIYIADEGFSTGRTWEEAISNRACTLNPELAPIEEAPEVEA